MVIFVAGISYGDMACVGRNVFTRRKHCQLPINYLLSDCTAGIIETMCNTRVPPEFYSRTLINRLLQLVMINLNVIIILVCITVTTLTHAFQQYVPDRFHVLIALCGVLLIFCSLSLYMYFVYNFIVITSGQRNLTTGRIAATHGRFNGIRQVAPVCTPPNMLPWAHSSPNLKRHLDWFSRFAQLTAGVPILYNCPFP